MTSFTLISRGLRTLGLVGMTAGLLAACGGGGGGGEARCIPGVPTMAFPAGCPGDNLVTTVTASLSVSLLGGVGTAGNPVTPEAAAAVQVTVRDAAGQPARNVAVSFTTTDKSASFVPASATALTDESGIARVGLPAGSQAGGYTVTASAVVAGTAVSVTAGYAVTFPVLSLDAPVFKTSAQPDGAATASLSAGAIASIEVRVRRGADVYLPAQAVTFTSPCLAAGKASIGTPVVTANGVASTSYTDKGCASADTITASTTLGAATFSSSGTLTVQGATADQIVFVSALPQTVALRGTGGAGRQESAQVLFKVLDRNGNPIAGRTVNFGLTTTAGGLSLNPAVGTSNAQGEVTVTVQAGIVNTPVRVLVTVAGTTVSTLSDQLVVSTGVADQNSFTVSPSIYNIECANHDGVDFTTVTAFVADHFNNPVPDGTAVSFTTESGAIDASCLTGLEATTLTDGTRILQKGRPGQCTARFICQNPRAADGRSTVLAYALGEESFADDPAIVDGMNRFDLAEFNASNDLREPFRYDRAISDEQADSVNDGTSPAIVPAVGEPYIDSSGNGRWDANGDGFYNGVLQTAPNGKTPTIHVRESFVLVFSTSSAAIDALTGLPLQLDRCTNGTPFVNSPRNLAIAVRDRNQTVFPGNSLPGNILPAGTRIEFTTNNGKILSTASVVVPNTNDHRQGAWTYNVLVQSDATQTGPGTTNADGSANPSYVCTNPVSSGLLTISTTTPLGVVTTRSFTLTD